MENNISTSSPLLISLPPLLTDYFDRSFFPDRSSFNKIQDEKKKICKVVFMTGKGELQWWLWNPARKPCLEKIASIVRRNHLISWIWTFVKYRALQRHKWQIFCLGLLSTTLWTFCLPQGHQTSIPHVMYKNLKHYRESWPSLLNKASYRYFVIDCISLTAVFPNSSHWWLFPFLIIMEKLRLAGTPGVRPPARSGSVSQSPGTPLALAGGARRRVLTGLRQLLQGLFARSWFWATNNCKTQLCPTALYLPGLPEHLLPTVLMLLTWDLSTKIQ